MKPPAWLSLVFSGALLLTNCGRGNDPIEDPADPAVMTYGYAPQPTGAVRLQPDVVIVKGGARAIRSVSADDLVWTIDGSAAGVSELAVGKVLFVTSRAVGRVVQLDRLGNDVAVTLAPVHITEVIRDGTLRIEHELTPDSVLYQETPVFDAATTRTSAVREFRRSIARAERAFDISRLLFPVVQAASPEGPATKTALKVKLGSIDVEVYWTGDLKDTQTVTKLGLKASKGLKIAGPDPKGDFSKDRGGSELSTGLKIGAEAILWGEKITIKAHLPITDGAVMDHASFILSGVEGMSIGILGGSSDGLADNIKVRGEVPIDMFWQFPPSPLTGGLPSVVQVKIKTTVETFFSSKNSTLDASSRYQVSGPFGFENGQAIVPQIEMIEPYRSTIGGISIGTAGLVFGFEFRILGGLGTKAFSSGLYGKLNMAAGYSRGSILGAPLALCAGISRKVSIGGGIGVQTLGGLLESLSKKFKDLKAEWEVVEVMFPVINDESVYPNVPICGGGK
jgi:hypothetical protein